MRQIIVGLLVVMVSLHPAANGAPAASARQVTLHVQRRGDDGRALRRTVAIDPKKAAIVVVDMWDRHWCKTYTTRVANLVPRMNLTLAAARRLGIQVVFAPSDVLGPYTNAPQRKAMQAIPAQPAPGRTKFNPPGPPGGRDRCECGPARPCKSHRAWTRQHAGLKIAAVDLIADCNNGRELLNLCGHRGIDTLIYMGVASNMCVMYRSSGMLNMKRHGVKVHFVSIVPFQVKPKKRPPGRVIWDRFDKEVLGCNYRGYDSRSRKTGCDVRATANAKDHPILHGLDAKGFHSPSWLYRQSPLSATTTLLMDGRWAEGQPAEPVAWTNIYNGGRVFYTTLGHPGDFRIPAFNRMLVNAIRWALAKEKK